MKTIKPILLSKYSVAKVSVFIFIFILIVFIGPYYIEGDQLIYRKVYIYLPNYNFFDGFSFYTFSLSSTEPIPFALSWIASRYLEKDLFIGIVNAFLAYAFMSLFQKWKVYIPIAILIVTTNFYILVLYFAAERLKYGMLFLILSFLYSENIKRFYLFSFLAILSHIQTLIIYGSIVFETIISQLVKVFKSQTIHKYFLFSIPFLLIPLYLMQEQIITKFNSYYMERSINEIMKSTLFLFMSLYYSKNKYETFYIFIPIITAAYLLGGDRVNMIAYFFFMYYALQTNRGLNIGVIVTSIYFLYKSIGFIDKIITYGNGFYHL